MKKNKKLIFIITVILICSMILPVLYSCNKNINDNGGDNINNNNNADNAGDNNSDNAGNSGSAIEIYESVYTSKDVADAIMAAYSSEKDIPEDTFFQYFISGVDENSDNFLDPERAGRMITGNSAPVKEFDYLEDYAMYVPIGNHFFEIDVMKIKDSEENNIDALKDILEKRIKRKDTGDIRHYVEEEVPLIENAKIVVKGRYVILLVTTDNGKAENIINDMIKSGGSLSLPGDININDNNNEILAETPNINESPQSETNKPVSVDEVVNVESEILFDIDQFKTLILPTETPPEQSAQSEQTEQTEQPEDNNTPRRTAIPSVTVKGYSENASFMIGGKCEIGAMIRVTGGIEELYTGSNFGDYLVEIPFNPTGTSILKLTAELDGKLPSEEITFIVKPQTDRGYGDNRGLYSTIIGYNYMHFYLDCLPDFIGDNLISDKEIESLKTRTAKRISDLRAKNCDSEIIYLLIPNHAKIWPENFPKRFKQYTEDSLLRQWKEGLTAGGATVLDLTDVFMAHKNDEFKLWQYTDSHWSEYGALIGYEELMKYIAQKFPDAAPRPRSDFEIYFKEVNMGDIYDSLELTLSDLCETATFVDFKFDPPHYNPDYNTGHVNIYDENCTLRMSVRPLHIKVQFPHTTESNLNGLKLPTAYFFRDSFEGPLHAFYTDRFSTATFKGMWDYNFNLNQIAALNPDYIIYVISERNIKNVIYE